MKCGRSLVAVYPSDQKRRPRLHYVIDKSTVGKACSISETRFSLAVNGALAKRRAAAAAQQALTNKLAEMTGALNLEERLQRPDPTTIKK